MKAVGYRNCTRKEVVYFYGKNKVLASIFNEQIWLHPRVSSTKHTSFLVEIHLSTAEIKFIIDIIKEILTSKSSKNSVPGCWQKIISIQTKTFSLDWNYFSFIQRSFPPFFFVYCQMGFWFWVGRSEKEKNKNKIGKGVWSYESRYLRIISVEPGNNKVWLQSQHRGNAGRKKSTSLKSNKNREKLKICKAKNCLCFRLKWQLFEIVSLPSLPCVAFFFLKTRKSGSVGWR